MQPVLEQLREEGHELYRNVTQMDLSIPDDVDFIITSTSDGLYTREKALTQQARLRGIPTLSVLDFWSHYRHRYSNGEDDLVYLPDKIAVMDEFARSEMILRGFSADILEVTGHPAFDCLADKRSLWDSRPKSRYHLWRGHGVHPERKLIVFGSQPLAESGYGFNQHQVIRYLINALDDVGNIHIVIRPHPRETVSELLKYERFDNPRVEIKRKGDVHDLCMGADLVIGMNSVLLVEACYLGCIVLSIQPGKIGPDRLPTNRLRFSRAVYEPEEIRSSVDELLYDEQQRSKILDNLTRFKIKEKGTPKVVDLIYRMMK